MQNYGILGDFGQTEPLVSHLSKMPFVNRAFIIVMTFVAVLDKIG